MGQGKEQPLFLLHAFKPPGPVCARYIQSKGPIDLIRGPWGSGKTVGTVFKLARHAAIDMPICRDGVVHVRAAAIRDTYREMAKTALASWHQFFPKAGPMTAGERDAYSGGQDRPVKHVLEWDVQRRWWTKAGWEPKLTKVRFEMEFGAIGEQNLDSFFKGYELSLGWMNECDLLSGDVPGRLYGRTGRYPPQAEVMEWEGERLGFVTDPDTGEQSINVPRIVAGDFNPPDEVNWTFEREIEHPENWPGYNFFPQPSGLSPQAENRAGKSRRKYEEEERAFGGPTAPEARRNVHGEYAAKKQGTVVYQRFSLQKHRADSPLEPVRELPFYCGFDAGGTPAAGIGQFMPNGQFRALREIVTTPDTITGPKRFAELVTEVLLRDFHGMRCGAAWGDPSAWYGADRIDGQLAFMEIVSVALQIPIMPTETNDLKSRVEAVDWYFQGDIDANTPRSLWDPRLKHTIRGFVSQYHLTKRASAGQTDVEQIDKNEFSHIQDAWQYLLYGYRGPVRLRREAAQMGRPDNVVPLGAVRARSDFDVFKS